MIRESPSSLEESALAKAPEFEAAAGPPGSAVPRRDADGRNPAAEPQHAAEPCVLLKLGEIALKGQNRPMFERQLYTNLRRALREVGRVRLWPREGVVLLEPDIGLDLDRVVRRAQDVLGIVWVHPGLRVPKTPEAAAGAAIQLLDGKPHGSFAVRARRRNKRFPMNSTQLASYVGAEVQRVYDLPVNLSAPGLRVHAEVDRHEVIVFSDAVPGHGGLPVGVSGRAVVLLSGGIDSPVAAYRMMRRGLRCDFLHFSGMPHTGPESIYKAYGLVNRLERHQSGSRLWVVPFGRAQQQLASSGEGNLQIVAQRRIMLKTAAELAARQGGAALVTGDALGQVSSQTLPNLGALDDSVGLPILRPLVGWDKAEIMAEARRLGTLETSELPDEDCCTLLAPRHAATRASIDRLRTIERRLDAGEMAEQLAAQAQVYEPAGAAAA